MFIRSILSLCDPTLRQNHPEERQAQSQETLPAPGNKGSPRRSELRCPSWLCFGNKPKQKANTSVSNATNALTSSNPAKPAIPIENSAVSPFLATREEAPVENSQPEEQSQTGTIQMGAPLETSPANVVAETAHNAGSSASTPENTLATPNPANPATSSESSEALPATATHKEASVENSLPEKQSPTATIQRATPPAPPAKNVTAGTTSKAGSSAADRAKRQAFQ